MAKVYISSTVADLRAERRIAIDWLVQAGHQPIHSYRPDSDTVRESCLSDIEDCDLYLLILGHRYGFQPEEDNPEKLSITHLEYRKARQLKIPQIALLRKSVPDIDLSDLGDPERSKLVLQFQKEVSRELRPAEFVDLPGLVAGLSTGVQNELNKLSRRTEARGTTARPRALPEFTMIRLYRPPNQLYEGESWSEDGDGKFRRNPKLAADPVFDIMVKYESSNTLAVYSVGIHLLQRIAETGGTMGSPSDVEVHSELTVRCPQNWKQTSGIIDDRASTEFDNPKEMSKDNPRLRFTLMLDNFCDKDNASSCELKFYLVTENGTAESRSIRLSQ
jgi:hypothetical protein